MRHPALVLISVLLTGCVHQVVVTYECDPRGAKLVEDGSGAIFNCPTKLIYQVSPADIRRGYINVDGMTAMWISGAKTHIPDNDYYVSNAPRQYYTQGMRRDPAIPDEAEDEQYALELEAVAAQQAEAQAEQQEANQQKFLLAVAAFADTMAQRPVPTTTTCDTYQIGLDTQTTCHQ